MLNKAIRSFLVAGSLLSRVVLGAEPSPPLSDWAKSPEASYLATSAELKQWKGLKADAERQKFVALFWARRDPSPNKSPNVFRTEFEKRVEYTDRVFALSGTRGALTERGKFLILAGLPKNISVAPGTRTTAVSAIGTGENPPGTTIGENITTLIYEDTYLPPWAGVKVLNVVFSVEARRDNLLGPADARRIETLAGTKALVHPELTEVPLPGGTVAVSSATAKPGAPPAPAPATASISEGARVGLDAAILKGSHGAFTLLPLAYRDKGVRLMTQIYLEPSPSPSPVRVAWLVRGKDGKEASRTETAAEFKKTLNGTTLDHALPLPPGDYEVAFVLLDGAGAVTYSGMRSITIPPTSEEFASSPLLVSIADLPGDGAVADSPFLFAGRRFVGRGDGRIRSADGMSYFVRIYSPGVDPVTKKAFIKRKMRIVQKGRPPIDLPAEPDQPVAIKDGAAGEMAVLDLAGTVTEKNIGEYFQPGEYTFKMSLEDTVRKATIDVSSPFIVVAPGAAAK
ncbi:MAG: GWxTD domain-containing protein [Thermoanaerobaculia bacterium]